jgi:hypothetical protein
VVDDLAAVALTQEPLGDRHSDAVSEPLPERPRRRLDSRSEHATEDPLWMPGRARVPLAKPLQLAQRQVVASEVQDTVEQHRAVAGRQDEAVTVGPFWVGWIVPQDPGVEDVGDRGHRHRQSWVAGARLLDGVHREHPDRVDAQAVELDLLDARLCRRASRHHGAQDDTPAWAGEDCGRAP